MIMCLRIEHVVVCLYRFSCPTYLHLYIYVLEILMCDCTRSVNNVFNALYHMVYFELPIVMHTRKQYIPAMNSVYFPVSHSTVVIIQ